MRSDKVMQIISKSDKMVESYSNRVVQKNSRQTSKKKIVFEDSKFSSKQSMSLRETNFNHINKGTTGQNSKVEMKAILEDEQIQCLLKELRISATDDGGVNMMKGIYSLGSYVKSIVSEMMEKRMKSSA